MLFSNNQIDISTLPKSSDLELTPISKHYLWIILINISLVYLVIIGVLSIINQFSGDSGVQDAFEYLISIICVLFVISVIFAIIGFKKRKYAMREKDITYSHGYIVNKTLTLPFNRIQHIEIARSFLARKFGVSTLKIYSAGQSGGDIAIRGLPKAIAQTQYDFLTKIINERL
ncbi:PH domain-containing protein [Winogradskyella sp.]|uniref:PH domain-containing protein n=1 Tax=Winogradskyella sp. TaxID=1883156 RepID=UPI003517B3DD